MPNSIERYFNFLYYSLGITNYSQDPRKYYLQLSYPFWALILVSSFLLKSLHGNFTNASKSKHQKILNPLVDFKIKLEVTST